LDKDEVIQLLANRIIHTGVYVTPNGNVKEIKFIESPSEALAELGHHTNNYRTTDLKYLKFNLILMLQLYPEPNIINRKVTRLAGTYKVYGDALVIGRASNVDFLSIDLELFRKMESTGWGLIASRDLTPDEVAEEKRDNLPIIMNADRILHARFMMGNNMDNNNYVCGGCYRKRYNTQDEQKSDWEEHKKNCLHEKQPINTYLRASIQIEMEKQQNIEAEKSRENEFK